MIPEPPQHSLPIPATSTPPSASAEHVQKPGPPPLLSATDLDSLRSFLADQMRACLHRPDGLLKYAFLTPTASVKPGSDDLGEVAMRSTTGSYNQMYDWDACFLAQAAARHNIFDVRLDIVKGFLALQQASGYVPRTISVHRVWDNGDMCKPFLCQTLLAQPAIDPQLIAPIIPALRNYLSYYIAFRRHASQLFCWRNVLESGVDNNLALLDPQHAAKGTNQSTAKFDEQDILAVDLNCYLVKEFEAFARLASSCNCENLSGQFQDMSEILAANVEKTFWRDELGMYANIHVFDQHPVLIRSWTGLLPVLLKICSEQRARQVIESTILEPKHFFRPSGIASTAASEHLYNNAPRGLYGRVVVCNWQGPTWILPNVLTVRALKHYGYHRQARELSQRVLGTILGGIRSVFSMTENYDSETGTPLWAKHFVSWNSLALELVDVLQS